MAKRRTAAHERASVAETKRTFAPQAPVNGDSIAKRFLRDAHGRFEEALTMLPEDTPDQGALGQAIQGLIELTRAVEAQHAEIMRILAPPNRPHV
jgi:hypothetical protein